MTDILEPGAARCRLSAFSALAGLGSDISRSSTGMSCASFSSRDQLSRAATNPFHWPIASSTGANARLTRMELAIMIPPEASWRMTSNAPTASTADCSIIRKILESIPSVPVTFVARR